MTGRLQTWLRFKRSRRRATGARIATAIRAARGPAPATRAARGRAPAPRRATGTGALSAELDADDLEPAGEAAEGELADLLRARAERLPVRAGAVGRRERLGDRGEKRGERGAHLVRQRRGARDGLAEVPDAVADVALLVVVDAAVAVDEAGQQAFALEVAGDEAEGGEPERALDDEVVGGDEGDLGRGVPAVGDESVVGLHEPFVEDGGEGGGEPLAGAGDVRGDGGGVGDDLVLEARVELHVARLVDLLGGEERRLLLAAVRKHETGELGGDALLGDHQRAHRPMHEVAVLTAHRRPLLAIGREVDRERAPLAVLPVAVERLRVVQVDGLGRHDLPERTRPRGGISKKLAITGSAAGGPVMSRIQAPASLESSKWRNGQQRDSASMRSRRRCSMPAAARNRERTPPAIGC